MVSLLNFVWWCGDLMKVSGFNGGNCILSNIAKLRVEKGWIDGALITTENGLSTISFKGNHADWNGIPLILSSSRVPEEPRIFKSIDGAISELSRIGIFKVEVMVKTS